jgi:hypothetical protein
LNVRHYSPPSKASGGLERVGGTVVAILNGPNLKGYQIALATRAEVPFPAPARPLSIVGWLVDVMGRYSMAASIIHTDDTPAAVLEAGNRGTLTARFEVPSR